MYERPGHRIYVTASTTHLHGDPVVYLGVGGVAVKQVRPSSGAASGTAQKQIASSEKFAMICKGRVALTNSGSFSAGNALYITSTHMLTTSTSGNTKFGLVVEVAGDRGTPTGQMRVDLDLKSAF